MIVLEEIPNGLKAPVVTMGSFDGVHLGHSSILNKLKTKAYEYGGESVVVTFAPHPRVALGLDTENLYFLNTLEEKKLLLEQEGIDYLVILPFTAQLAAKTQEEFFVEYFVEQLGAKAIIVGYNHRFGSDKESDHNSLALLALKNEIELVVVDKMGLDEKNISSTTIRNLLLCGEMRLANMYLGYNYFFLAKIGSDGGIIYLGEKKLFPPNGTYEIKIEINGNKIFTKGEICKNSSIKIKSENTLFLSGNDALKDVKISLINKVVR